MVLLQWLVGLVIVITALMLAVGVGRAVQRWRWEQAHRAWRRGDRWLPRVVVIGGGFGGLQAVRKLAGAYLQVVLVDRRNFHLFQPLLYQVATGSLSPANVAAPLRAVLSRQWNALVWMGEVSGIDVAQRRIRLSEGQSLDYDMLVVATGARHSYFGNDHWSSLAPGLKTIEDATAIRARLFSAFEAAERMTDASAREPWLTFVIVGAGPTGVELAGALAEITRHTLRCDFRSIDPRQSRIVLVEGQDRVLPTYPEALSTSAKKSLERLGVEVWLGWRITALDATTATLQREGEQKILATRTVLWAAGVQASPLAKSLAEQCGLKVDRQGRIPVLPDLTIEGHPEVFVIGDMARREDEHGSTLPGVAPVAIQQGKFVARTIRRRLRGKPVGQFRYRDLGSLATIGRSSAVADFGRFRVRGFVAWVMWLGIHLANLALFQNRLLVLIQWTWSFVTFGRAARLITNPPERPASDDATAPPAA